MFSFLSFFHHPTDIDLPWLRPCCSTGTRLPLGLPPLLSSRPSAVLWHPSVEPQLPTRPDGSGPHSHVHARSHWRETFSTAAFKREPLNPSATRPPPADGSRGDLEKLPNVTLPQDGENLHEEENKLLLVHPNLSSVLLSRK